MYLLVISTSEHGGHTYRRDSLAWKYSVYLKLLCRAILWQTYSMLRLWFLSGKALELCAAAYCAVGRLSRLSDAGVRYVDAQRVDYTPHHALDCSWPVLHWTVQIQLLTTQGTADWSLWKESFLVQRTIFEMITAKMDHSFQIYDFWIAIHWTLLSRLGWRRGRGRVHRLAKMNEAGERSRTVFAQEIQGCKKLCACGAMIAQVCMFRCTN